MPSTMPETVVPETVVPETVVPEPAADDRTSSEVDGLLKGVAPFQDLPDAVYKQLQENSDYRTYEAGQTVYSLGQYDGGEFFLVSEGVLKVAVLDGESGSMHIEEFTAPSLFGLEAVLSERPSEEYQRVALTAQTDVKFIAIDAEAFRELTASRPTLMRNIAMYFAGELAGLRFKMTTAKAAPEQLIYAALLELVKRDEVSGQWLIEKMPKHRELADKADVDEAVSANAVASLIQDGVAKREYPGLIITDIARLNQLAV